MKNRPADTIKNVTNYNNSVVQAKILQKPLNNIQDADKIEISSGSSNRAKKQPSASNPRASNDLPDQDPTKKAKVSTQTIIQKPPVYLFDETDEIKPVDLEQLTKGKPFREYEAKRIQDVLNIPITLEGLTNFYSDCFPGAKVSIPVALKFRDNAFEYTVSAMDNSGKEVGTISRYFMFHKDGSLELKHFNGWINPEYRGKGISARVMLKEMGLLKQISKHPDTRMTLYAAYGINVTDWDREKPQKLGTYTWANFGFDFADKYECGEKNKKETLPQIERMKLKFSEWVEEAVKQKKIPQELSNSLIDASKEWRYPWDISNFRVPGLKINSSIGGKNVPCDIGKTFLTSDFAPEWPGIWLVNKSDFPGKEIGLSYCGKTIDKSDSVLKAEKNKIVIDLFSQDKNTALSAIKTISEQGGKKWLNSLKIIYSGNNIDSDIKNAALSAIKKIKGDDLEKDLLTIINNQAIHPATRVRALERLRIVTGKPLLNLFENFLRDKDVGLKGIALLKLNRLEENYNPELLIKTSERLLPEALLEKEREDHMKSLLLNVIVDILGFLGGPKYAKTIYEAAKKSDDEYFIKRVREILENMKDEEAGKLAASLPSHNSLEAK